jgi:hypothetical protein
MAAARMVVEVRKPREARRKEGSGDVVVVAANVVIKLPVRSGR